MPVCCSRENADEDPFRLLGRYLLFDTGKVKSCPSRVLLHNRRRFFQRVRRMAGIADDTCIVSYGAPTRLIMRSPVCRSDSKTVARHGFPIQKWAVPRLFQPARPGQRLHRVSGPCRCSRSPTCRRTGRKKSALPYRLSIPFPHFSNKWCQCVQTEGMSASASFVMLLNPETM